jgi:hypothetical protein
MQWRGRSNHSKEPPLKTAMALVAVLLLAACAAGGEPAGSSAAPVKYDGGNVVDSQNAAVTNSKF